MEGTGRRLEPVGEDRYLEIRPQDSVPFLRVARTLFRECPTRSLLGATLTISQSFPYNAIFFTYGLVLKHFHGVSGHDVATYFFAFAAGNLAGPLLLGRLFDTVGRRQLIASTYLLSGTLPAISGYLFKIGALTAGTQSALWTVIFFIASAAASKCSTSRRE